MEPGIAPQLVFTFSKFEITPLMFACAIGNLNIVKIILQSPMRESMKELDKQGFNCLYYAVYHGHLEIV
jgi:ankyrin repeat protein